MRPWCASGLPPLLLLLLLLLLLPGVHCLSRVIDGGELHSCAILTGGDVKCWGNADRGQLGYEDKIQRGDDDGEMGGSLPVVSLGAGLSAVALSTSQSHTCALLNDGSTKCWGLNSSGQLGRDNLINRGFGPNQMGDNLDPLFLGTGTIVIAISAGWDHTCAILDSFVVKCWGGNSVGQLGYGDKISPYFGDEGGPMGDALPTVPLGPGFEAMAIAAGDRHTCVISLVGTVKCWGLNEEGQLGLGDRENRGDEETDMGANLPEVDLGEGRTAVVVTTGKRHSCALLDDGSAKCWGRNNKGQLGYGDTNHRGDAPNEMGDALLAIDFGLDSSGQPLLAVAIDAGAAFTCAILHNGWVKCWGDIFDSPKSGVQPVNSLGDDEGEMGDSLQPIELGGLTAVALAAGATHAIVVLEDASVKSWGWNANGQLGVGDTESRGDEPGDMGSNLPFVSLGGNPASLCQLGFYAGELYCEACPAGTRGLAMAALDHGCVDCLAGYFSATKSVLCTACATGTYSSAKAASCTLCPAGSYSTSEGSSTCTNCPPGTSSNSVGASSNDSCVPIPRQEARCYVSQPTDDKLALRVDDEVHDSTYFFVDQLGRARINTNVFDGAEETLVVSGNVQLRGDVYLGDDVDEEATVQKQLARRIEHGSSQSGMLLQHGKLELLRGLDGCTFDNSYYCVSVLLTSPVLHGTQTVMLTITLTSSTAPPPEPPNAWVTELNIGDDDGGDDGDDDDDDAVVRGFSIQATAPAVPLGSVAAEVHWIVVGVAA